VSVESNKFLLRRLFQEILNGRKLAVIPDLVGKNYHLHNPPPGLPEGIGGFTELVRMYHAGFPDLIITIEELIGERDMALARWTGRSTHKGPFMGIPPTGKAIAITGMTLVRIADRKVVEEWTEMDTVGMLRQMGVVPA